MLVAFLCLATGSKAAELRFADFNDQGPFNCFSGDNGTFASRDATFALSYDAQVFHGTNGTSLRVDYSVRSGYCGLWQSLLGKASFPEYTLNFTNLYGPIRNSTGNPTRVEHVAVTNFSLWARGDGNGDFQHELKIEFKSPVGVVTNAVVLIPNTTNWARFDVPLASSDGSDFSKMKEVVLVLEDWRNGNRVGRLYLDDFSFDTDEPPCDPARLADDELLDLVQQRAFAYFMRFTDDLGFALDRSTYSDIVSVGGIGFQLSAYCIGHRRGWADPAELEQRVVRILQNLRGLPMGPEPGQVRGGYRGFYYHFLAANSGRRKSGNVELSLYDTMLLMYGVLSCREYFPNNTEIQQLSRELFDRVEWDWFVDHAPGPNQNQFHLGWQPGLPDGAFFKHVDGQTDEAFMVDVLALGSATHPVSLQTYLARNRVFGSYPEGSLPKFLVSWGGSLFNYFFASCWMNFQDRGEDVDPVSPQDLWEDNRLAIAANRLFCVEHPGGVPQGFATYATNAWGLTACDNLVPPASGYPSEYFSFGALPTEENIRFGTRALSAGTLAVYGAVSSINFLPGPALEALRHDFEIPGLWNPLFGFGDAFSLDPHFVGGPYDPQGNPTLYPALFLNGPWVNHMARGINVGPMLLAIENYRSRMLWDLTARNPEMSAGLDRIFRKHPERAAAATPQ
ncbi:MAG: glucoamylase family protein [Verrucomicrobiota bacterium]